MKSYFCAFTITFLLNVAIACNAMEHMNPLWIGEKIEVIKEPRCVRYCTKNRIAIAGSDGCTIVDLKTKKHEKLLLEKADEIEIIPASDNNKETVFYRRYDEGCRSFTRNPHDTTIFRCYGDSKLVIRKYNYVTGEHKEIPIIDGRYCEYIAIHPHEKIACIADLAGRLFLHTLDDLQVPLKTVEFPLDSCWFFCRYSFDGSYIIAGDWNKVFIIDPSSENNEHPSIQCGNCETIRSITLHPHGSVLAMLSRYERYQDNKAQRKVIVRYWDIATQQLIDTPLEVDAQDGYDLDFSADGLECIIVLKDKCIRTYVPFTVKEKCAYVWWILKQLEEQKELPQDVVHYCGKTLWKHCYFK